MEQHITEKTRDQPLN